MFTVQGRYDGDRVAVTWDDGLFSSPDEAVLARIDARLLQTYPVLQTPTGPSYPAAVQPDYIAYLTVNDVLDNGVEQIDGDEPEFPPDDTPEGAEN